MSVSSFGSRSHTRTLGAGPVPRFVTRRRKRAVPPARRREVSTALPLGVITFWQILTLTRSPLTAPTLSPGGSGWPGSWTSGVGVGVTIGAGVFVGSGVGVFVGSGDGVTVGVSV